jgi:hypothetical protein
MSEPPKCRAAVWRGFVATLSGLLFACLATTACMAAERSAEVAANLPRGYVGIFSWYAHPAPQKVQIRIVAVEQPDAGHIEARGCGRYDVGDKRTVIAIRMRIDAASLAVEIWESDPFPNVSHFTTQGSHLGKLTADLRGIDAEWTTFATGEKGLLRLRADPHVAPCANDMVERTSNVAGGA